MRTISTLAHFHYSHYSHYLRIPTVSLQLVGVICPEYFFRKCIFATFKVLNILQIRI